MIMITVFGHKGFIGSQIVKELEKRNLEYFLPERDENVEGKDLGKVIYCIGLTADAKRRPFETINAHINKLSEIIRLCKFEDITYASSARVYVHGLGLASEAGLVSVDVSDPFELFNLTKLTAESLLLNTVSNFKSVRYSNVYGTDLTSENFLTSILTEAIKTDSVTLYTTPDSSKDYISVNDAAKLTVDISLSERNGIYNVASGINRTNKEITDKISGVLKCRIVYAEKAKRIVFPTIDIFLIKEEFKFKPSTHLIDDIDILIDVFHKGIK